MHLFCDESGNTGVDLLNADQPVFALASTCIATEVAKGLIAPLLRKNQREAKYRTLKGSRAGQNALIEFFSSPELQVTTSKFTVVDKRYYLVSHLVDKLIEPPIHEAGLDLYERDGHVGLTNVWFYTGHTIFPHGYWKRVLNAFLHALRRRDREAFATFDTILTRAYAHAAKDSSDFATGLFIARGRLDEFIGVYGASAVFDPAVDAFALLIQKWMSEVSGRFAVTHDQSKPLRVQEPFIRALMAPLPARTIGYQGRQGELPLRISELDFGDSTILPQLQVADLIAGAAIDALLAWSGKRQASEYHAALEKTRLADLYAGGMLPSPDISDKPSPLPGEQSLVDGAAEFLTQVGYFSRETR